MDAKFQWTYQFFNSRAHQDIGLIPNRMLQSLNMNTVKNCVEEYQKIIFAEVPSTSLSGKGAASVTGTVNRGSGSDGISPCYNLRRQLVHSLADFGLDIASYQSPMKATSGFSRSQSLQKHFPPVSIRNYMYVISPLPQTWTETLHFLEGKRQSQNDMNLIGPRKSDILEVLKGVKDAFFDQGLWDRFLDQRTSLSWVDTNTKSGGEESVKTNTRISATLLIRSTLELIIKAFGGHIIPQHILCQTYTPRDAYSFATIFQMYRSLQIHPGLGVKMSKDSWQAIPSTPIGVNTEIVRPVNVLWTGDLLCARSSQFICSIDLSEPHSTTASDDALTSKLDQIESIRVLKRISSQSITSNLHSIRIASTMMCFPQNDNDEECKHASYLLKSLRSKNDVLLLELKLISECTKEASDGSNDELEGLNDNSSPRQYTRFALLHPTTPATGVLEVLEEDQNLNYSTLVPLDKHVDVRPFSMAMMEKSWSRLGAFVDQANPQPKSKTLYRLEEMPSILNSSITSPQVTDTPMKLKWSMQKPMPGDMVENVEDSPIDIERVESIDDPCLNIRKAYIKYLYQDETVSDYVRRLNATSKEITALAAKQGIPLKDAQQKLVTFIIEFLRIWPSKMGSKYKQIAKELNIGRTTESRNQGNYVFLDDERPELDAWKVQVMKSVKDENVRMYLRKLKAKDTQIQIVQNLHILLLIDKYGLEENKPFKKDPGAQKTISLFMDELCIAASVEDQPSGLMSPQTPRSKDMDSAKKFFTRVVARYYEPSLPKIVEKLAIKCGVETSLLTSPRPSRGSKRAGIKRSISLGVLQKPSRLDLNAAMQTEPAGPSSSSATTPTDGVMSKGGVPLNRQLTSENPSRNVLNSSIFRNRQVVMTRGSVQGVGVATTTMASMSTGKEAAKSLPGHHHSKSKDSVDMLEDEDAPPKIAKLRLKQFYHDKESEEVLKLFRRQRPLSKADDVESNPFIKSKPIGDNDDNEDSDDDGDLGALGKYLHRKGTTSWGVIKSTNVPTIHGDVLKSPSRGAAQRRSSPKKKRDTSPLRHYSSLASSTSSSTSLSLPSESIVPSTPTASQKYGLRGSSRSPSTPTRRAQLRRHQSQQSFFSRNSNLESENDVFVPTTPTRRAQVQRGRNFASQIRGDTFHELDVLGSPSKRRRGGNTSGDDDDGVEIDNEIHRIPQSPSLSHYRRSQQVKRSPIGSWLMQPSSLLDELHAMKPDRKRIHLDDGYTTGSSKTVLVPGTPSSSLTDAASEWAQSKYSNVTVSVTSSKATESSLSSLDSAISSRNTSSMSNDFFMSTPKSTAKSAAFASAHFGLTPTSEMYISSPTPILETRTVEILESSSVCTYKTCRRANPSRQHAGRRHTNSPYLRQVDGKIAKFSRLGKDGDEERPFQCCCGKEYHNTRSLADHLSRGCEDFKTATGGDSTLDDKSSRDPSPEIIRSPSPAFTRSPSSKDSSEEDNVVIEEKPAVTSEHDAAMVMQVIDLEVRMRVLERKLKEYDQAKGLESNQDRYSNGSIGEYWKGHYDRGVYSGTPMTTEIESDLSKRPQNSDSSASGSGQGSPQPPRLYKRPRIALSNAAANAAAAAAATTTTSQSSSSSSYSSPSST
ncbi:hypothetical protein BGX27_010008 [Mortierella sp. AM989]|nr:hypothetical protein BGX27_010008 [Mortierella sp. AM989]